MNLLHRVRRSLAARLTSPADHLTLFPLAFAEHYPAFSRGFDNEAAAAEDILVVRKHTMTKYDRCVVLHNCVKHLEDRQIGGALMECGVWRGGSAGIMALANQRYGTARRSLWLFDAWGDWYGPGSEDANILAQQTKGEMTIVDTTGGDAYARGLLVDRIKYPAEHVHLRRGLFADSFPKAQGEVGDIALLRIDSDFYDSIELTFSTWYERVVSGGIVMIDDYGYCEGARRATDEFLATLPAAPMLHFVDYTCRYFIKP